MIRKYELAYDEIKTIDNSIPKGTILYSYLNEDNQLLT